MNVPSKLRSLAGKMLKNREYPLSFSIKASAGYLLSDRISDVTYRFRASTLILLNVCIVLCLKLFSEVRVRTKPNADALAEASAL